MIVVVLDDCSHRETHTLHAAALVPRESGTDPLRRIRHIMCLGFFWSITCARSCVSQSVRQPASK